MLALWPAISTAQSALNADVPVNIFAEKPLAVPHVHVETLTQFVKWSGKKIPQGEYNPEYFEKTRLGTVAIQRTPSGTFRATAPPTLIKSTSHFVGHGTPEKFLKRARA
jgi:hypothetical protein